MKVHLFCIVALILTSSVYAVGVSPPRIILEDIPKGYAVEKAVILSGVEANTLVEVSFEGEGSQWVKAKLGSEYITESDDDISFPFIINVSEDALNGEYEVTAQIVVAAKEQSAGPNSATVSSGILVNIKFTVTGKEVQNYQITNVKIPNAEAGSPLFVVMDIQNRGNVIAKPRGVEITVKDKKKETVISSSSNDISSVEPYSTGESVAVFNLDLEPEFYFADITIFTERGREEVKNAPFDIYEKGALKAEGEFTKFEVEGRVESIAKLNAFFKNKGEIDLYPVLKAEVYHDDVIVDLFESKPEYVRTNEEKKFTHYYKVPKSGDYIVKAHLEYLGKETQTREVLFKAARKELNKVHLIGIIVFAEILIAIVVSSVIIKRKKKE